MVVVVMVFVFFKVSVLIFSFFLVQLHYKKIGILLIFCTIVIIQCFSFKYLCDLDRITKQLTALWRNAALFLCLHYVSCNKTRFSVSYNAIYYEITRNPTRSKLMQRLKLHKHISCCVGNVVLSVFRSDHSVVLEDTE